MAVKINKRKKRSKLRLFLLLFFLFVVFTFFGAVYIGYLYFTHDLPNLKYITGYKPKLVTEVYSSDGTLIAEFYSEYRKLTHWEKIPKHVIDAFIAVEDKRFYDHKGIDLKSIIAAMVQNIKAKDWVRGASTITQQVTKNIILSPEKSLTRKIKEALLAYRIENNLSKQEILYLYLNQIYLADGTYGVQAASNKYFNKSIEDINIAEAALLAGLPKRPEYYSPRNHLDRALNRQKLILKKMEEENLITREERLEAEKFEIKISEKKKLNDKYAPYFVEHVRRYLENMLGTNDFLQGGYKIFTTLDVDLSLAAQWSLREGIINLDSRNGSRIVFRKLKSKNQINSFINKTNKEDLISGKIYETAVLNVESVKSDNSSYSNVFKATLGLGNNEFELRFIVSSPYGILVSQSDGKKVDKYAPSNGYVDVSILPAKLNRGDMIRVKLNSSKDNNITAKVFMAPKTQGALLSMDGKGFIKAMVGGYDFDQSQFNRAIQAYRQPGSSFKPIVYSASIDKGFTETSIVYDIPVIIKDWAPSNYDGTYNGPMILRNALTKSRNLASVRLLLEIDPKYVVNYSKKFGFKSPLNPYPSLALGGSEVTVLEMANAFNVFATGGKLTDPKFILRIYDRNDNIIEDNTNGKVFTKKQIEINEREIKIKKILEQLAKKKGRDTVNNDEEILIERQISRSDFDVIEEASQYLNSEEFLEVISSNATEFIPAGEEKQTIPSETAFIMTDLLEGVIKEGTGRRAYNLNSLAPVAGKTGTTNDFTDAWFVGFSPRITTAVWVGKDNHKSLGRKEAGSRAALPIWISFMKEALKKYPGGTYEIPNEIRFVNTPYGNLPYSIDSLRSNVIDSLRHSVINLDDMEKPYGNYNLDEIRAIDQETEIDFLLRR